MSKEEDFGTKLLGFRINKTGSIIIAYLCLIFFIQYIPTLFYSGQSLVLLFIFNTLPELLANIGNFIQTTVAFIIPVSIVGLIIAIFILCVKLQNSFRDDDIFVKWLSFSLTKASLATLFILSLVYLIMNSFSFYSNFVTFIEILQYASVYLINHFIVIIVTGIILLVILIYTLIVCVKNRENIP